MWKRERDSVAGCGCGEVDPADVAVPLILGAPRLLVLLAPALCASAMLTADRTDAHTRAETRTHYYLYGTVRKFSEIFHIFWSHLAV